MGGFGLFLEPGGRPLGLRFPTSTAPSLGSSLSSSSMSLSRSSWWLWWWRISDDDRELFAASSMAGSPT
ncbi:hypothetical protein F8388_021761 [Cannabis sativa]|uniref:Uncharacterized protein n=1 Tax=Cannabis sativa TaxID=3483 RepID=A0A7J6GC07_CANSA|nr:hypothetical protein F8388_021761 [Cannabis sativa]KAF4380503.1 hypothetical protein G4B88_011749 [Cannabis sativa]